jgi:hypothetical protein
MATVWQWFNNKDCIGLLLGYVVPNITVQYEVRSIAVSKMQSETLNSADTSDVLNDLLHCSYLLAFVADCDNCLFENDNL